jgi:phosphate transport system substrate-binding protein
VTFKKFALAAGLFAATIGFGSAQAADISGAGATFPYPVYAKWADTYKKETGVGMNYQSIGSGGGIKQIKAKTVTFGASDAPLKPEELAKAGLVQFPTVIGGVVPIINVPGLKPGEVTLDGQTLADIFHGKITKWNDEAIKKLNANVNLPDMAIAVVRRSDGSGTSFVFTKSVRLRPSNGRSASAPRAMKASPPMSARPRVRSATSSMPSLPRTACPIPS